MKEKQEEFKNAYKDKEKKYIKQWLPIFIPSIDKFDNSSPPTSFQTNLSSSCNLSLIYM